MPPAPRKSVSRTMLRRHRRKVKAERSSLEIAVETWLKEAGIPFESQHPISLIHVDIFLPPKTVVELSGCYWHACPRCNPDGGVHKRQRAKDMRRYTRLWKLGYKVLVIWEHEVKENFDDVKQRLRYAAGMQPYAQSV